jgi:hypothetical protein
MKKFRTEHAKKELSIAYFTVFKATYTICEGPILDA